MNAIILIVGHQTIAWALGMAISAVLLDSGNGFTRDHPPLGWRLVGLTIGPIALLGYLCLAFSGHFPVVPVLLAPFTVLACRYSWSWLRRYRAPRRRRVGRTTVGTGVLSMLLFMLCAGPADWSGGIVIGAYTASAALLGGFSTILLTMLTANAQSDEVTVPPNPFGMPARFVATGLGITLMAAVELVWRLPGGSGSVLLATVTWMALSLAVPIAMMGLGHKLFPRFQRPVWFTATASALMGQGAILFVLLLNPGLVPPTL